MRVSAAPEVMPTVGCPSDTSTMRFTWKSERPLSSWYFAAARPPPMLVPPSSMMEWMKALKRRRLSSVTIAPGITVTSEPK